MTCDFFNDNANVYPTLVVCQNENIMICCSHKKDFHCFQSPRLNGFRIHSLPNYQTRSLDFFMR